MLLILIIQILHRLHKFTHTVNPDASNNINKATFTITDAKHYVPIVTLKPEDNTKLSELLSQGFKRQIYWNEYKVILNKIV